MDMDSPPDTHLPNPHPHTPPYTPFRATTTTKGTKRPLSRTQSPGTSRASSIHPTETVSPQKAGATRTAAGTDSDSVRVVELADTDPAFLASDAELVYPASLSEAGSRDIRDGDDDDDDDDDELSPSSAFASDSDGGGGAGGGGRGGGRGGGEKLRDPGGVARRLSRLHCTDAEGEARFALGRRRRRLSKRLGSRVFKRTHSQSATGHGAGEGAGGGEGEGEGGEVGVGCGDESAVRGTTAMMKWRGVGVAAAAAGGLLLGQDEERGARGQPRAGMRGQSRGAPMTPERDRGDAGPGYSGGGGGEEGMEVDGLS
ncbi:hypothetical protein LTR53_006178 [Teratosphaeriaceae sp. CCFEE 6253]|nr:hypothetical protein LTR53_006178 [Teratosphaeriaceae sp. CCFEE 6253]